MMEARVKSESTFIIVNIIKFEVIDNDLIIRGIRR